MNEEKNVAKKFHLVDEIFNMIKGLDEKVDEVVVVQNVLRYISYTFNAKVSSL